MKAYDSKRRVLLLLLCGLPVLCLVGIAFAGSPRAAERLNEHELKAAFLFNLAKYVEWPSETFASPGDSLAICILGKGDIEEFLRQVIDRKVAGHTLVIRRLADAQEASGCQLLFVNESVGRRWLSLEHIKSTGILTVGETDDFVPQGGAVNLKLEETTIHIQVNLEATRRARLELSSKLLALSEILKK